jgi:hypothetical protein
MFKTSATFRTEDQGSGATAETVHTETNVSAEDMIGQQQDLLAFLTKRQQENAKKLTGKTK